MIHIDIYTERERAKERERERERESERERERVWNKCDNIDDYNWLIVINGTSTRSGSL